MSKTIVVTGGAGGICSDICRGLATDGVNVVVADYAKEAAEKVAAEIRDNKGAAIAVKVDVGDPESVAEMMRQAIAKYGQIDYAFCGAGIMDRIPVIDMPEEVWDRLMRINLKGVFLCAQAAARHMMPRKEGRILSIASGRGVAGAPRSAHYAASKAGVIAFQPNRSRLNWRPTISRSTASAPAPPTRRCRESVIPRNSFKSAKKFHR